MTTPHKPASPPEASAHALEPLDQTKPQPGEPAIFGLIRRMHPQILMALPRHFTAERMIRMSLTCLRQTPKLVQCDQRSLLAAIMELSQLGLEPSTPLGHAWILPYGARAQVIIGYKGYVQLADRSEISLGAEVVYENDRFEWPMPGDTRIVHKPCEDQTQSGALKYVYAYALRPGRPIQFKALTRADIDRARASSAAYNKGKKDSPWFTDEPSMWRKTAVRRLASFLPLSSEFIRAVELDEQAEQDMPQEFDAMKLFSPGEQDEAKADEYERRLREAQEEETPFDSPL